MIRQNRVKRTRKEKRQFVTQVLAVTVLIASVLSLVSPFIK